MSLQFTSGGRTTGGVLSLEGRDYSLPRLPESPIILLGLKMTISKGETAAARSAMMSRIRSKDTKPEMLVRKALHHLGFRFRLHVRGLPGCPDVVLPKYRTIIQVKGCFWHGHTCIDGRMPKSNREYWVPKLRRNKERDISNDRKLRRMGWSVRNLWECRICAMSPESFDALLICMLHNKCPFPEKWRVSHF